MDRFLGFDLIVYKVIMLYIFYRIFYFEVKFFKKKK